MKDSTRLWWTVRAARFDDVDVLVAGNVAIARETEGVGLDPETVGAGVRAVLNDPARGFYLVAVDGADRAIGQLMVTFEWSDWRAAWWWWIQSVHVDASHRRSGVYRALHAAVLERARAHTERVAGVRLYVEHANRRAQDTYTAVGMQASVYRIFEEALASDDAIS